MGLALPEARIDDIVCAFIGAVDPYKDDEMAISYWSDIVIFRE